MRNGDTLPLSDQNTYDPNADLQAHTTSLKRGLQEKRKAMTGEIETYMNKEQLQELRKVQRERDQISRMKLVGMNIGQTFGVRMDGNEFEE